MEYRNSPLLRKAGRGDTVSLIYENRFIDGHLVSTGRLLGIELQHGKEVTPLYWFEDGTKGGGYYYANGADIPPLPAELLPPLIPVHD